MSINSPLVVNRQTILIDWDRFEIGLSAFIPCVDRVAVATQLRVTAKARGYIVQVRRVIERDRYGVRIWRMM